MSPRPAILDRVARLGHVVFESGGLNLNLIGVRSRARVAGRFDDVLHVVYRESPGGAWVDQSFACTTDPGRFWLANPGRVEGTAIVVPGQYRGCWEIGKHKGQYEALVQRAPMKVWRDADRDQDLDTGGKVYEGIFGINLHRANSQQASTDNDKWSAGCTVIADPADFAVVMGLCKRAAVVWGNRFTYTLIDAPPESP